MERPTVTPIQLTAKRTRRIRPNPASVEARPWWARQPTKSPTPAIMVVVMMPVPRSARVRPKGMADRAMGMERNRSTTPSAMSLEMRRALAMTPVMEVMANSPGMRYSR